METVLNAMRERRSVRKYKADMPPREIIDKMASEGKRYVGWFPATQGPSGKIVEFDLIFEAE